MQKSVHPTFYKSATVNCLTCGTVYNVAGTVESTTVEICSHCHPFYTGQQKLVDTAGKVEKFRARQAAAAAMQQKKVANDAK